MFSKDNTKLLYSNEGITLLYDLASDKIIKTFGIWGGKYSNDGTMIAGMASYHPKDTNFVLIYDANSFDLIGTIAINFTGSMHFCLSADSKYIISEHETHFTWSLPVWDIATGKVVKYYTNPGEPEFHYPAASFDGKYIAVRYKPDQGQPSYLALFKANWNETSTSEPIGTEERVLYPNPATGIVNIELDLNYSSKANIVVTDLKGLEIENQDLGTLSEGKNILQYNTSKLSAATYFLKVETDRYGYTFKFVKE